ncbi:hypothetical protein QAD02_014072 [Eretmocerus hayati]|uniref:Uncharacterized protein n=1 Tax=Eretmocerus hayati TaxID=131215 RepID=A0ACC2P926_9HYME|nr:hypothetical protein QAD02_014072 [Eretmocerus hayati]
MGAPDVRQPAAQSLDVCSVRIAESSSSHQVRVNSDVPYTDCAQRKWKKTYRGKANPTSGSALLSNDVAGDRLDSPSNTVTASQSCICLSQVSNALPVDYYHVHHPNNSAKCWPLPQNQSDSDVSCLDSNASNDDHEVSIDEPLDDSSDLCNRGPQICGPNLSKSCVDSYSSMPTTIPGTQSSLLSVSINKTTLLGSRTSTKTQTHMYSHNDQTNAASFTSFYSPGSSDCFLQPAPLLRQQNINDNVLIAEEKPQEFLEATASPHQDLPQIGYLQCYETRGIQKYLPDVPIDVSDDDADGMNYNCTFSPSDESKNLI